MAAGQQHRHFSSCVLATVYSMYVEPIPLACSLCLDSMGIMYPNRYACRVGFISRNDSTSFKFSTLEVSTVR